MPTPALTSRQRLANAMSASRGDVSVNVTTTDGARFVAVPVVELRKLGMRLSVRSGFGPTDGWVEYAKITDLHFI